MIAGELVLLGARLCSEPTSPIGFGWR